VRWLAVINPRANHTPRKRLECLAQDLGHRLGARSVWTTHPGQGQDIARNSRDYDGCIVVGGDGTIAEVVNGLDLNSQRLGIVPAGTGNGLARDLGVVDFPRALRLLRREKFAPLDLIKVCYRARHVQHERYLISTFGFGYASEIVQLAIGSLKPLGHWRYAAAASIQTWLQEEIPVRMRLDGRRWEETVVTNLLVNNTRHSGPFCVFPQASLVDGRLDLLFGRESPWSQLIEDLAILSETFFFDRSVRRQAETVELELSQPTTMMFDGELVPEVEGVQFEVVPAKLRCCAAGPGLRVGNQESRPVQSATPAGPDFATSNCFPSFGHPRGPATPFPLPPPISPRSVH
jgi:diacylglycerol kinase (ATP)